LATYIYIYIYIYIYKWLSTCKFTYYFLQIFKTFIHNIRTGHTNIYMFEGGAGFEKMFPVEVIFQAT